MAKRFTDTAKWDKAWFRKLSPKLKCAYEFLRDRCDLAGVWEMDLDALEFFVGERVTLEEMQNHFQLQVIPDNKLFLPGFIEFQYGELSEACKPHQSVIKRLKKLTLWKEYAKGMQTLKDKDKEKEKDKDKDKEKENFECEALYQAYPRKEGKTRGLAICKQVIKSQSDYDQVLLAVNKYSEFLKKQGTEKEFIKHFDTFMRSWKDWLDPETGSGPEHTPRLVSNQEINWDYVFAEDKAK